MSVRRFMRYILIVSFSAPALATEDTEYARLMNIGKAFLENRNAAKAVETFEATVKIKPESEAAWRNLARAQLLARNADASLVAIGRVKAINPESASAAYLEGLAFSRLSRFPQAAAAFENAARLDPDTAAVRFQLAGAYQAGDRHDDAKTQLKETLRLDPLHASAHFKLAGYARKERDRDGFQRHHREFMRLRQLFGEEARSAEALEICIHTQPEPWPTTADTRKRMPLASTIEVRFTAAPATWLPEDAPGILAMDVVGVDERGRCVFALAGANGSLSTLAFDDSNSARMTPAKIESKAEGMVSKCIVGDFLNDVPTDRKYNPNTDAHEDILLATESSIRLLKHVAVGEYEDVSEASGLKGVKANDIAWADYDHDGDLDLLLASVSGFQLWQNGGNGKFENVTEGVGLDTTGSAKSVVAVDLDADVAVDIVVARGKEPTIVYRNQRAGRYARIPEPPGPLPPAEMILSNDLDNNGLPDLVLIGDAGATIVHTRVPDRETIAFDRVVPRDAALLDYDNDGWLDLLVAGRSKSNADKGSAQLWRNLGAGGWTDVSAATGLDTLEFDPVAGVIAGDVDGDGDTDLTLLTAKQELRFFRNEGGHVNGQLKLRLTSIKTNPSAIGTHVEARAGVFWISRSVNEKPIELGLGGRKKLDSVQTVWTNGVVDNQIDVDLDASATLSIAEKNVATGSCPYLYTWDGSGFRFVTDLLGNSPLGLSLKRDVVLSADPDEIVYVGDETNVVPRNGRYVLEITEETRELLYLDFAKLIVVDHPTDTEVHPTDKLMPPPFPESELVTVASPRRLRRASGDGGLDRTTALSTSDGVFAAPGLPLPSPYRGMCHPLALTLDFGPIEPDKANVLVLTGWLQYGDASTNIAMSQNVSLTIIPPMLEVETAPDVWTPVDVVVGMPAGKTKTILVDLTGKLPAPAGRLRLSTTFEIRWDRIALFTKNDETATKRHELPVNSSNLYFRGFSEIKPRSPGHPATPAYEKVAATPPWRTTPQGWCTRWGNVDSLIATRDEKLAIINAGDALTLTFRADALPPKPKGTTRSFFLYTVGWDKDADHNVIDGDQVEPLPIAEGASALDSEAAIHDWQLEFNTRWVPRDQFVPVP